MKLEKKHWAMLIAGAVVLFLVYWFFFRKKKTESGFVANLPMIGESGYSVGRGYDPGQNLLLYQGRPLVGESGYSAGDIGGASESGFSKKFSPSMKKDPPIGTGKWTWTGQSGIRYCSWIGKDGMIHDKPLPCPTGID